MNVRAALSRQVGRFLPSGSLRRAVMLLAGGSALAQAISILASPIATRLYAPADYGTVAVFNSLLGVAAIVASLRFELAVPLPIEDDKAIRVLVLCFVVLASATLLIAGAVWAAGGWIAHLMKSQSLEQWLWLLPIGVLGAGTYQALYYWTLRRKRYAELARTRLSQSIFGTATMLGIGAVYGGPLGLILAAIVSQTAGILLLWRDPAAVARTSRAHITGAGLVGAAREYRQFPALATGAALLNSAASVLPPLLFYPLYGEQVTGWFALAQKVVLLPMSLVGLAIGQVFLGEAAEVARQRPEQLAALFKRVTGRLLPIGLLVLAGGAVSPLAFPVLFGQRWSTAGVYAACLSVFCAVQLVVSPVSSVAILRKRLGIQLAFDALRAVLVAAALCVPYLFHQSGLSAVVAYSATMTATYGLYYLVYRQLTIAAAHSEAEMEPTTTAADVVADAEVREWEQSL